MTHPSPALEHLAKEFTWLRQKLIVALREKQAIGLLPGAENTRPGAVVYLQEVEARIHETKHLAYDHTLEEIQEKQKLNEIERQRNIPEFPYASTFSTQPLKYIKEAFYLTENDYLIFLLAAAPAFCPSFPRLYAFLQNNFQRQYPSLSLFLELFVHPDKQPLYANLLDPASPLISNALIEIKWINPDLPIIYQPISLPHKLQRFLCADPRIDSSLASYAELRMIQPNDPEPILSNKEQQHWDRLYNKAKHLLNPPWNLPLYYFTGPFGCGKRKCATEIARLLHKNLFCIDAMTMAQQFEAFATGLKMARREAVLQNAVLCLFGWEKLIPPTTAEDAKFHADVRAQHEQICRDLDAALSYTHSTIIITCENAVSFPPRSEQRNTEVFHLKYPDHETSLKIWEHMIPFENRPPDLDLYDLAQSYRLTPGQIENAVAQALFHAPMQQPNIVPVTELQIAIKEQMRHRLSEHAVLLEKRYKWEDLIVTRDVETQLKEIIARYKFRAKVLSEWGLGDRFGHDLGLSALFDGPPGTGKSMCANLIASEIGIDIYQVDLSRVMSKYVGETEKNLAQIFNEAENAQAMLLFDEADSLFGSRTNVKNSNDKYANLEVNYLLQRIERFPGVAILTTNFPAGIDEAFARRLSLRVSFPKPSKVERARLWASMLKNEKLPKDKINCKELAEEFEISGGYIRNAILRGAFIAAANNEILTQDILYTAARIEMKSMGMLVSTTNT